MGSQTETALIRLLLQHGVDFAAVREGARVMRQWPFNSKRKFAATAVKVHNTECFFLGALPWSLSLSSLSLS